METKYKILSLSKRSLKSVVEADDAERKPMGKALGALWSEEGYGRLEKRRTRNDFGQNERLNRLNSYTYERFGVGIGYGLIPEKIHVDSIYPCGGGGGGTPGTRPEHSGDSAHRAFAEISLKVANTSRSLSLDLAEISAILLENYEILIELLVSLSDEKSGMSVSRTIHRASHTSIILEANIVSGIHHLHEAIRIALLDCFAYDSTKSEDFDATEHATEMDATVSCNGITKSPILAYIAISDVCASDNPSLGSLLALNSTSANATSEHRRSHSALGLAILPEFFGERLFCHELVLTGSGESGGDYELIVTGDGGFGKADTGSAAIGAAATGQPASCGALGLAILPEFPGGRLFCRELVLTGDGVGDGDLGMADTGAAATGQPASCGALGLAILPEFPGGRLFCRELVLTGDGVGDGDLGMADTGAAATGQPASCGALGLAILPEFPGGRLFCRELVLTGDGVGDGGLSMADTGCLAIGAKNVSAGGSQFDNMAHIDAGKTEIDECR